MKGTSRRAAQEWGAMGRLPDTRTNMMLRHIQLVANTRSAEFLVASGMQSQCLRSVFAHGRNLNTRTAPCAMREPS